MPSVDSRVVEMRFENKDFEKGIGTSISSLEKLKGSLNLGDSSIDLSVLEKACSAITKKFSTLGTAWDQVVRNVVNGLDSVRRSAVDMVESLTVGQIESGWDKYEKKTASVQTLINATGKDINEINGYLDRLMWYSDETSFGFSDMTQALQTMVTAGGDIDNLVPLLMGVGNAVGYAGKGAAEFSRATMNLSQSYGMGYLSTQDWRSLELAGVSSKQLKEELLGAAVALGKINKSQATMENFSELMTDKVFTRDVMERAFNKFAEVTLEAEKLVNDPTSGFETASEAYEYLSKTYDGFSMKAATAAQEAKTFTEAIDATKDAVSSGWMKTFELLIGDYEESKTLFTWFTEELWEMFASGADARNKMMEKWHDGEWVDVIRNSEGELEGVLSDGTALPEYFIRRLEESGEVLDSQRIFISGYQMLLESLHNFWDGIKGIVQSIRDGLADIFPPMTYDRLLSITGTIRDFSERFKEAFSNVKEAFEPVTEAIEPVEKSVKTLAEAFDIAGLAWRVMLGEFGNGMDRVNALESMHEGLYGVVQDYVNSEYYGLETHLGDATQLTEEAVEATEELQEVTIGFLHLSGTAAQEFQSLKNIFTGFGAAIDIIVQTGKALWKTVLKPILKWCNEIIIAPVLDWLGNLGLKLKEVADRWKENNTIEEKMKVWADRFRNAKDVLEDFWERFKQLPSVVKLTDRLKAAWDRVWETLKGFGGGILGKIADFFDGLGDAEKAESGIEKVLDALDWLIGKLNDFLDLIDGWGGKISDFFGSIFKDVNIDEISLGDASSLFDFSGVGSGIINGVTNALEGLNLKDTIGKFIGGIFTGSSELGSTIVDFVTSGWKAIKGTKSTLFDSVVNIIETVLGHSGEIISAGTGIAFVELIHNVAQAFGSWSKIPKNLTGTLSALPKTFGALTNQLNALAVLEVAAAIGILVNAIIKLQDIDSDKLANIAASLFLVASGIALIMAAIAAIKKAGSGKKSVGTGLGDALKAGLTAYKTAATLIGVAVVLVAVVYAFKQFMNAYKNNDPEDVEQALLTIVKIIGSVVMMLAIAGAVAPSMNYSLGTFAGIALVLAAVSLLIKSFTKLPAERMQHVNALVGNMLNLMAGLALVLAAVALIGAAIGRYDRKATDIVLISTVFPVITGALVTLASAMILLDKVSPESFVRNGVLLGAAVVVIGGIITAISAIKATNTGKLLTMGVAFNAIAASLLVVVGAMKLMEMLDPKRILKDAGALAIIVAALGVAAWAMGQAEGGNLAVGLEMIEIAGALVIVAAALRLVGELDPSAITAAAVAIGVLFGVFLGAAALIAVFDFAEKLENVVEIFRNIAIAMAIVSGAVLVFAVALQLLCDYAGDAYAAGQNLALGIVGFLEVLMAHKKTIIEFIGMIMVAIAMAIIAKKMEIISSIAEVVGGVVEALKEAVESSKLLRIILPILAVTLAGILDWLDLAIDPIVGEILVIIAKIINAVAKGIIEQGDEILKAVNNILMAVIILIGKAIAMIADAIADALQEWFHLSDKSVEWLRSGVGVFDTIGEKVVEDIEESQEKLRESSQEYISEIKRAGDETSDAVQEAGSKTNTAVKAAGDETGKVLAAAGNSIEKGAEEAADSAEKSGNVLNQLMDGIADNVDLDTTLVGELGAEFNVDADEVLGKAQNTIEGVFNGSDSGEADFEVSPTVSMTPTFAFQGEELEAPKRKEGLEEWQPREYKGYPTLDPIEAHELVFNPNAYTQPKPVSIDTSAKDIDKDVMENYRQALDIAEALTERGLPLGQTFSDAAAEAKESGDYVVKLSDGLASTVATLYQAGTLTDTMLGAMDQSWLDTIYAGFAAETGNLAQWFSDQGKEVGPEFMTAVSESFASGATTGVDVSKWMDVGGVDEVMAHYQEIYKQWAVETNNLSALLDSLGVELSGEARAALGNRHYDISDLVDISGNRDDLNSKIKELLGEPTEVFEDYSQELAEIGVKLPPMLQAAVNEGIANGDLDPGYLLGLGKYGEGSADDVLAYIHDLYGDVYSGAEVEANELTSLLSALNLGIGPAALTALSEGYNNGDFTIEDVLSAAFDPERISMAANQLVTDSKIGDAFAAGPVYWADELLNAAGEAIGNAGQAIAENVDFVGMDTINSAQTTANGLDAVLENIKGSGLDVGPAVMDNIKAGFQSKAFTAEDYFGWVMAGGTELAVQNALKASGIDLADNYVAGYTNEMGAAAGEIEGSTTKAFETANPAAMGALGEHSPSKITQQYGVWYVMGLRNGIMSSTGMVLSAVNSLGKTAVSGLNGMRDKFYDAGYYADLGLARGINNYASVAINAARNLASAVSNTLRNSLRVESPSKVTAEIGKYFSLGFAQGINKYAEEATYAAADMGEGTIAGIQTVVQRINDAFDGDFDTSPTIRPVLDLTEIQNGASTMGGMFNGLSMTPDLRSMQEVALNIGNTNELKEALLRGLRNDIVQSMNEHTNVMREVQTQLANQKIYLDKNTVVGAVNEGLAQTSYRRR